MKETRVIMGMPVTVELSDAASSAADIDAVFAYFADVDERFSTYKEGSEIMRINRNEIEPANYSYEMKDVFALAERTKQESSGYFDIKRHDGMLDPSGMVKGWAILNAARLLEERGTRNFYVEAGGDIQARGRKNGADWSVGIRNPFRPDEIVKVIYPRGRGVATSGSYMRGAHIYNPFSVNDRLADVVSITVVGPDVLEADRFATAAFAMGRDGVQFIEALPLFEAYSIDAQGVATMTSGFASLTS